MQLYLINEKIRKNFIMFLNLYEKEKENAVLLGCHMGLKI